MYGDIQAIGVFDVSPTAELIVAGGASGTLGFLVPGFNTTTDTIISAMPVSGVSSSILIGQGSPNGDGNVEVLVTETNDGTTIPVSAVFRIIIARSRSINSGVLS